ncbi:hypothetical protein LJB42_002590 [Komagataella kurtzmanii]|nr:hypothetical protein LJB42_002590 [Komagataella kurtzmanii]
MYNPYGNGGYGNGIPQFQQNVYQGQQQPQQQPQQQAQQQAQFQQPQPTGFQPSSSFGVGLVAQQTGIQPQGLQNNPAMFQQQQFQPGLQSQQTGFNAQVIQSQPTGYSQPTSSAAPTHKGHELKIPAIRLSFITQQDQEKFEQLFKSSVPPGENAIDGSTARDILLRSNIPSSQLAEIWTLSDTTRSGKLLFPEFALALHLCNVVLRGENLPFELPTTLKNEVSSFVDVISFGVGEEDDTQNNNTPFSNDLLSSAQTNQQNQQNQPLSFQQTGFQSSNQVPQLPQTSFGNIGIQSQPTGLQPVPAQKTGSLVPVVTGGLSAQQTGFRPLQSQSTGYQPSLQNQTTGYQPPLQNQTTGYQPPLQNQTTGYQPPLQNQTTGYQQPLQNQTTGYQAPLQSQSTGYKPLQAQTTGFQPPLQNQTTGYQQPLQSQNTGFQQPLQSQTTGYQPLQSQTTGYQQPLQSQITGFQQSLQSQPTGLQPMPTGKPGQWGFVATPTGGLPGLDMMQSHFMPNSSTQLSQLQQPMNAQSNTNVPWAITKNEKQIYDKIFKEWDQDHKGYIDGPSAISIFGKSGLARQDLEKIWNLADQNNRGRLNKDEFAVAMHLVYRRLNGLDIPNVLPPELIPPSSKILKESLNDMKTKFRQSNFGSSSNNSSKSGRDGTRFKNNDDDFGYVSRARHSSKKEAVSDERQQDHSKKKLSIPELKKLVHEKQIILDAYDSQDTDVQKQSDQLTQKTGHDIEILKAKIKNIQSELNEKQPFDSNAQGLSKRDLRQRIDSLSDKVSHIMDQIFNVEEQIQNAKIEQARLRIEEENPSGVELKGTGPNGIITESDKRHAKSRAILKSRMASLTGKTAPDINAFEANEEKLAEEVVRIKAQTTEGRSLIEDVQNSIKDLKDSALNSLEESVSSEVGFEKWEKGQGVSSKEVKELIKLLNDSKPKVAPVSVKQDVVAEQAPSKVASVPVSQESTGSSSVASEPHGTPDSYSSYKNPADRAKYIKEQAEKRMNERLQKLGISRKAKSYSSPPVNQSSPHDQAAQSPIHSPVSNVQPSEVIKKPTATSSDNNAERLPEKETPAKETVPAKNPEHKEESSDDDNDEELRKLMEEKARLEEQHKQKKLKKKQEREAKLAELRKQMEEMKKAEESDDSWDEKTPSQVSTQPPPRETPAQVPVVNIDSVKSVPEKPKEVVREPVPVVRSATSSEHNPFSKPSTDTATPIQVASSNPFFKPQQSEPVVDPVKIEAQRLAQRGAVANDDDDDWGDSDGNDSSEGEAPTRNSGPAHLASLLFRNGSLPKVPTTESSSEKREVPASLQSSTLNLQPESQAQPTKIETSKAGSSDSDSDSQFGTPTSGAADDTFSPPPIPGAPPVPQAPPIPQGIAPPPVPQTSASSFSPQIEASPAQPGIETNHSGSSVPPVPQTSIPAVPPSIPSAPPLPQTSAPPAPPAPPIPQTSAPPAPPAPPIPHTSAPPAPPTPQIAAPSAPTPTATLGGGLSALLGEIQGGKALRKVDPSSQHISEGTTVGRVL